MAKDRISISEYREHKKQIGGSVKGLRDYKQEFLNQLHFAGLPMPDKEIVFAQPRKFRWDFAFTSLKLAVEYQGGIYYGKRGHSSVTGLRRDYEKYSEGAIRGWVIILIDAETVRNGKALEWVQRAFEAREAKEAA